MYLAKIVFVILFFDEKKGEITSLPRWEKKFVLYLL